MNTSKQMNIGGFLPFFLLIAVLSCGDRDETGCVFIPPAAEVPLRFVALEDTIAAIETKDELVAFLSRHPLVRDQLLLRSQYPNDSVFINTLFSRFTHPGFDSLLMETKRIFGDQSRLRDEFTTAFSNLRYYYPDAKLPLVQTVITGLESDLVVTDTLIVIGLDYYLGKEGKYRPRLYDYLLSRYEPDDIVASCMLLYGIGNRFNQTSLEDKTVVADMIAYGKSFYFAKHMLPCTPDSVLISYTPEEIRGARENENLIWSRFIADEILFSTAHVVKQKFLGERPKTLEIGEQCPGRIAQWVGWQIVNSYMDAHPDVTLPELMETADAGLIFKASRYKPSRR